MRWVPGNQQPTDVADVQCTITAPHGMQGQCFGIPLNVGDSAIATGRNTAVDTHCQQTFPK